MNRLVFVLSLVLTAWTLASATGMSQEAPGEKKATPKPQPATQLPAAIAKAPDRKAHPLADGIVLETSVDITVGADKKVTRKHYSLTKIFREYMMSARRCDVRIPFDAAKQTFACTRCRTWMRSGKAVDTDPATGFVQVTPDAFAAAPDYTDRRECVLVHTGVEHGATMEREYVIADREPSGDAEWMEISLAGPMPILRQRVTIRVPEGTAIVLVGLHAEIVPEKTTANGVDVYVVERANVPAINMDECKGFARSVVPRLLYSAVPSWADVGAKLSAAVSNAVDQSPRVRARVDALCEGRTKAADKIYALHDFVATNVRTVPWHFDTFGFPVRKASVVAETGYGHAFDKAVLLKAMLKDAGIASSVVLAAPDRAFAMRAPTPTQFDQVWLAVDLPDRRLWLDPVHPLSKRDAFDLEGHATLKLDARGANVSRVSRSTSDVHQASLRGEAGSSDDGTLAGTLVLQQGGRRSPYYALRGSPDAVRAHLSTVTSAFGPGATVGRAGDVRVAHLAPGDCVLTFSVHGGRWRDGARTVLRFPDLPGSFASKHWAPRDRRTTPLFLSGPVLEMVTIKYRLPAGYRLARPHEPESVQNALGTLSIRVTEANGIATYEKQFIFNADVVQPKDYAAFRALVGPQLARRNREIALEPIPKQ